MGNQQDAMSNQQIPSGGADQNGMRLRGKFNSRGSSSNQATSDNYGPIANGGCSDSSAACVSVRISGYETIYRSLEDAMLAILRQSLTEGRPVNAELIPNEYAITDFSNGNKHLGPVWDMIMSHQFMDLPDDKILQDISSMIPPVSDRLRNMGLDQQLAQLNAEFGMDAMQGMMDELKDMALNSGGSVAPLAWAGYALIVAAAPLVYEIGKDAYNAYNPDPYSNAGDFDGDGTPNGQDNDDDNDGIKDWDELPGQEKADCNLSGDCEEQKAEIARRKGDSDDNGIIYETEGRMIQVQVYEIFRSYQQMYMGLQNPFYMR
jgi:hypothetical protein